MDNKFFDFDKAKVQRQSHSNNLHAHTKKMMCTTNL